MTITSTIRKQPIALWDKHSSASQMLKSCDLCEHHCKVDRTQGVVGFCKATDQVYLYSEFMHYGIEMDLIPSYAVFFSACSLRCVFCSSLEGLKQNYGVPLNAESLAHRIDKAADAGARTVLFVGGEPSIHPHAILEIAINRKSTIPFVLDTNLYMTPPVFELLSGVVEIYLADFKFGNDQCAQRLAAISHYLETLQRNILLAQAHGDLYIRHILLPGHFDCCYRPVAEWLGTHAPDAKFHIVESYEPAYLWKERDELQRKITQNEFDKALELGNQLGLKLVE